jgi:hypothetical protein
MDRYVVTCGCLQPTEDSALQATSRKPLFVQANGASAYTPTDACRMGFATRASDWPSRADMYNPTPQREQCESGQRGCPAVDSVCLSPQPRLRILPADLEYLQRRWDRAQAAAAAALAEEEGAAASPGGRLERSATRGEAAPERAAVPAVPADADWPRGYDDQLLEVFQNDFSMDPEQVRRLSCPRLSRRRTAPQAVRASGGRAACARVSDTVSGDVPLPSAGAEPAAGGAARRAALQPTAHADALQPAPGAACASPLPTRARAAPAQPFSRAWPVTLHSQAGA